MSCLPNVLRPALVAALSLASAFAALPQEKYDEPWRPQYHFTPPKNFMNDPIGLVYYKGEYHLFYQYNPQGTEWGHMSWGHAVSTDMLHWKNLPVAIPEEPGKFMIYSGSAVVDWHNSSGLCKGADSQDSSCLIAIYTAAGTNSQKQNLAFSNDRGRTWKIIREIRSLICSSRTSETQSILVCAADKMGDGRGPCGRKESDVSDSRDLKTWILRGSLESVGNQKGQWECPDLFALAVDGNPKNKKWVLVVNRSPGAPAGALASNILWVRSTA